MHYFTEKIIFTGHIDRMPSILGTFLSQNIYGSELLNGVEEQTPHDHAVHFIDVVNGKDTTNHKSFMVR
jgi:hypothetical protein